MLIPIKIEVNYDKNTGTVTCTPDEVTVQYMKNERKPFDSTAKVQWEISGRSSGHTVRIMWAIDGPFPEIEKINEDKFVARGNTRVPGVYKYAVLFVDENGQVKAGVDPDIINEPIP
ncbi:MAG: hypothetical protein K8R59_13365 [Thermoanaerobaculales bacterium]|nr:hypothetical protein [Thermoanaerobaculales bacterium]